ncbi:2,3,4,5-tetrahydropyridine-2,6-dicarboxylate N-acetyltransferase [subsurface metagenome]
MSENTGYMIYELFKDLPVTRKSKNISRLLRLSKIPLVGRNFLIKVPKLFINGRNTKISRGFYCKYGNIEAEDVYLSETYCIDYGIIRIGKHTTFSSEVVIVTSSHDLDDFRKVIVKPVTIGENVRIEMRVIIFSGVNIGDNTVIGAGSVVTKDIPAGVLAAGVPCKVIRKINRGTTKWWE